MPRDPLLAAPRRHFAITTERAVAAGFFVGPERHKRCLSLQRVEHFDHPATPQHEAAAQLVERTLQGAQGFVEKDQMCRSQFVAAMQLRLVNIQSNHRSAPGGFSQRTMVLHAQVALEPHKLHRIFHRADGLVRRQRSLR